MAKEKNKTELPKVMEGELQARLVKLREDAGFDTSQMAAALCLSEEVIINLENEAFELLAEPPYVRGYLRNYAKLGNNDASELITRYEALRGADASELNYQIKSSTTIATASQKRISPVWGQVILLGILVSIIALVYSIPGVNSWVSEKWESFSSQLEPKNPINNPSLLGDLPVPTPLPEDLAAKGINNIQQATSSAESSQSIQNTDTTDTTNTTTGTQNTQADKATDTESVSSENTNTTDTTNSNNNNTDSATTETTTTDSITEENITEETDTVNTETTETVNPDAQEIASTSLDGSIKIKLVFNKEVWLRIKDKDNKTVFEGLNKADTDKTINLLKPLTFRVGNAQGLSLLIDDKAVDISTYINGSIANFTLE